MILGGLVAVAAAIRSIWSPCGLSMLSTITPMAEGGRGYRFRSTAAWFVIGAVIGGAMLGGVMAVLAVAARVIGVGTDRALAITALAALVAAASDGRVGGFRLPGHTRQVNERWLDRYRSWVYGAGFGWQIGTGLATYIMTAGVYLLMLMGALTASPVAPVWMGVLFGLARGLAVYLSSTLESPARLLAFHARFEAWREPVRRAMIVLQAAVAVVAALSVMQATQATAFVVLATVVTLRALRGPHEDAYLSPGRVPGMAG